jgi:hypothetical protein
MCRLPSPAQTFGFCGSCGINRRHPVILLSALIGVGQVSKADCVPNWGSCAASKEPHEARDVLATASGPVRLCPLLHDLGTLCHLRCGWWLPRI